VNEKLQASAPLVIHVLPDVALAPAIVAPAAPRPAAAMAKPAGNVDPGSSDPKRADAQHALRLEVRSGKLLSRFNDLSTALNCEGRVADARGEMRLIRADPKLKGVQKESQLAAAKARLQQLSQDHEQAVKPLTETDIRFATSAARMSAEFQNRAAKGSYLVKAPEGHALVETQQKVFTAGGMAAVAQITLRPRMLLDTCMSHAHAVVTGPARLAAAQLALTQAQDAYAAAEASESSGESAALLAKLVEEATKSRDNVRESVALAERLLTPTLVELSNFQAKQLAQVDEAIESLEKLGSKADLFTRMFKRDIHNDAMALEQVLKQYRADCILGEGLNSLTAFGKASTPESMIDLARGSQ